MTADPDRPDGFVENGEEKIGVSRRDVHRRGAADGLAPEAAFAEEQAELAGVFDGLGALFATGRFRRAVLHKLDAEHQALAANIADDFVFSFQFFQASENVGTEFEAVLLGLFLLDDFEHGLADCGDNGVTGEGVEVNFLRHHGGDFRCGHDRGEWGAVADALGQRDDVGDNALRFEAPKMRAGAAAAGLNFVGDAETAGGAHVFVGVLEVALGELDEAAHALDGLGEERGDFSGRRIVDEVFDVVGAFHTGLGVAVAEVSAVRIRGDRVVNAEGMGCIEFPIAVGGEAHRGGAAAVVAVAERDGVVVAGVEARHEQCEVVGLGAGVGEINDLEIAGHFRGEFSAKAPMLGLR